MGNIFQNHFFIFVAVLLISVPIIIHLINRMRFKRIRWAAMEFLLKAQKRTRRRLIIEQLILLALRCFLIGLVGLLVARFVGCGDSNVGGKPNLHLVLLDDTLSMQEGWKQDGNPRNAFDVAKNDVILKKIGKGLSQSKTTDRLVILPLSKLGPSYEAGEFTYDRLNDKKNLDKLTVEVNEMQPSMVHATMTQAIKKAKEIIGNYGDSTVTLHVISDFREKEWAGSTGEGLTKELVDLVKDKKGEIKVRIIDTVHPARASTGHPKSQDNVGIVDFRPDTRLVGKNMPVPFTILIKNFSGKLVECMPIVRDEASGKDLRQIDLRVSDPTKLNGKIVKLDPDSITTVTFEHRFNPEAGDSPFAHVSVRLVNPQLGPLENDGLLPDNIRHAFVEVRDKVPILVIDSDPDRKKTDREKDSFFISSALRSAAGGNFEIVYGDELAPGSVGKALERTDLHKFPSIFVLNVPDLNPKQVANLETYVKNGGGVAFFMGPNVVGQFYNRVLYKDGNGIFPAPIEEQFYPKSTDKELEPKGTDTFQLITRDEKFPDVRQVPIFGKIFDEPKHKEPLRDLPIRRYFKVNRALWKAESNKVFELATLPNDTEARTFASAVIDLTQGARKARILNNPELAKYKARVTQHLTNIENHARPESESKGFHLADQIDSMLNDKAPPDMTEFFAKPDPDVQSLKRELASLRDTVRYGDPFIVFQTFGKGKVTAVMSTAGKDWNDFAGGSAASVLYAPFIIEMHNFLSSSSSEANLMVGANIDVPLDEEQFKGAQLNLLQYFMKTETDKRAVKSEGVKQAQRSEKGKIIFTSTKHDEPGLYITELVDENVQGKVLATYAHAFNVDTLREGDLNRVSSDVLKRDLFDQAPDVIQPVSLSSADDNLVGRQNDFSESPWLFLLFLFVLVAEQALAVHLSFHMQGDDQTPAAGTKA